MGTTQATTPPASPNPALHALEFLVGDWTMELSNSSFLPRPTDKLSGPVSLEWVQNGAFLMRKMGDKSASPAALWLIHRDESVPGYTVLYYDARSVSRVYAMSFADAVWCRGAVLSESAFRHTHTLDRRQCASPKPQIRFDISTTHSRVGQM